MKVSEQSSTSIPVNLNSSILLVDDERRIRETIVLSLMNEGFSVDRTGAREQGFKLLLSNSEKYDLIITDLSMPKLSGIEMVKLIRKTGAEIPIIISTGGLGIQDKNDYKDVGINKIIQKPWTMDNYWFKLN